MQVLSTYFYDKNIALFRMWCKVFSTSDNLSSLIYQIVNIYLRFHLRTFSLLVNIKDYHLANAL